MKRINWTCPIDVFPNNNGVVPDGFTEGDHGTNLAENVIDTHGKTLVFTDNDTNEIVSYQMTGNLCREIAGLLKMHNKALDAQIRKEQEEERARQLLAGGNGGQLSPEQMERMARQMRGEHG
jgi:hypothetical protein